MRKIPWKLFPVIAAMMLIPARPLLSRCPQVIESIYAHGLYKFFAAIISPVTALVPFSFSEIFLYAMIVGSIYWIGRGIRRRRFWRALGELAIGGALVVLWFYLVWGMNYFRQPIDRSLHFTGAAPDSLAIRHHFEWAITQANAGWQMVPEWSMTELDGEIEAGYRQVFAALHMTLTPGHRRPKTPIIPAVLDYTLTSGIFGPLFHEVHLNAHLLPVELPFVLAHEKAHQLGYAREDEASFCAALVCLTSADPAVRYSAQFALLGRTMSRYRVFADYDSLRNQVRPEVIRDFESVWERVQRYLGPIAEISEHGYDLYLKANQVEGGIQSYGDVVDLLIRWREKNVGALLPG